MEEVIYDFFGGFLYCTNATFRARAKARWKHSGSRMMIADIGLWTLCFALVTATLIYGAVYFLDGLRG